MRYEAVLFDVGDTLISPRGSFGTTYARVLARHGLRRPPGDFEAALRAAWDELGRTLRPGTDRYTAFPGGERGYWLRLLQLALKRLAPELDEELADRALDPLRDAFREPEAWVVYDDVVPSLTSLIRRGVRLGVVSNWDSRLPALLDRLGLESLFEEITVSAVEGFEKPDPRIFAGALRRLGVPASRTLHVGDRPDLDRAGAESAGIDCRLIDRHGRLDLAHEALRDLYPLPEQLSDAARRSPRRRRPPTPR